MKARVSNNTEKNNEIILSIGMIVKNEEKHLENCLSALKNLTDHISSELIIVDTGSTDRTKEIALKYTDKVYDFEWIDDFAAARNYGLKKAKGKWFMFLDADEYFDEDCSQMIKFFTLSEYYDGNDWNCASFSMYNYSDVDKKKFSYFTPLRLAKLTPELQFEGKIHEHFINISTPIAVLETVVHHYGYVAGDEFIKKKKERNIPLMLKELKERPNDARLVGQLYDSSNDKKEREKYVELLMKLIHLPENEDIINYCLMRIIRFYISNEKHNEALKVIDQFLEYKDNSKKISVLDIYIYQANCFIALYEFEKAKTAYEKYFVTYKQYEKCELLMTDASVFVIDNIDEDSFKLAKRSYFACLIKTNEFEKAKEIFNEVDIEKIEIEEFKYWIEQYYILFDEDKDYPQAIEIYQKALATKDKDKIKLAVQIFENFYSSHLLDREDFVNAIAESDAEGLYIDLMKIVRADNNGEDITSALTDFIHRVDDWKYGYAEAIYLCMKHNIDINDILVTLSNSIMKSHFPIIATTHEEYAQTVIDYCKSFDYTQSIHAMLWMTSALETAVLSSANLYEEQRAVLYDTFVCVLSDYIYNIYNQELLNVDDVDVLPELHRFGFYMTLAFTAQNDGDDIGYIRCLREALRLCEPMKDLVSFYLDKFAEKMKNE